MPWGMLSLNIDPGITWWVTALLSIAIYCPCYSISFDNFLFDAIFWTPWKWIKIILDSGSRIFGILAGSFEFFSKFWWGSGYNWVVGKGDVGVDAISYNRNKWCTFLTLAVTWIRRKSCLGSWHMSAMWPLPTYFSGLQGLFRSPKLKQTQGIMYEVFPCQILYDTE